MSHSDEPETLDTMKFSKKTLVITGNRKLYVYQFDEELASDSQVNSTGNISLEGTKTDD